MIISVKVKPHSGKQEVIKQSDGSYTVQLKERAEDNKANLETVKLLQRYFKHSNIKIKSGLKSRNKLIEIT